MIVLLVACLLSSFFVRSVIDISLIATLLRTAAVSLLLLIAARTIIAVYSEQYAVTTRTVCITKGLLLKKKVKTPIYRIAKQTVKQSFGERLLKIGNVFMSTYSGQIITFKEIRDPQQVSDLVSELRTKSAH
jgi:membrane protein YdbS with pleckstrin-like domain